MDTVIHKHITHTDTVLIREFIGKITLKTILESWQYIIEKNMITKKVVGVINNLTASELDMNFDDFQQLMVFLKENEILRKLKLAVITEDPNAIIFPTMGEFSEKDLKIKPFSTEKGAIDWLLEK